MWSGTRFTRVHKSPMKKQVLFLLALLGTSFLVATTIFWLSERGHGNIQTFGDAAWWWFVTSSTVGYGDMVPDTGLGRAAGVLAIVIGLFGYTHIIGIILQFLQSKFEEQERGRGTFDYSGHVVICEYTAFADELIQEIMEQNYFEEREIIIVSSLVERTPYPELDFVYGVPISPKALKRANISEADTIFVFSNIRFTEPDIKTLHVVSRIMKYNDHAEMFVELENPNHPLLSELPREVTVMKSADLLQNALQHKYLDFDTYQNKKRTAAVRSAE